MKFPGHLAANGRDLYRMVCLLLLMAGASSARAAGGADAPAVNENPPPAVKVVSVRRVFQDGGHDAFTDLCRFRGQLWLVFRSCPDGHMVHPTASIVVLRSVDGLAWEEAHRFRVERRDTRDPHFLVFQDKLFVYTGTWYSGTTTPDPADYDLNQHLGYAAWSDDGARWHSPVLLEGTFGHYIWRAAAYGGKAYLCGRRKTGFEITARGEGEHVESLMLESDDGLVWRQRAVFQETAGDETAFLFEPDGSLLGVGRRSGNAQLLRAKPPYTDWVRTDLDRSVGGPLLAKWGDRILVGGRKTTPLGPKTSLFWLVGGQLREFAELPSGGDNSYPGFLELAPGRALVSYYSSHERDAAGKALTAIYLAELELSPGPLLAHTDVFTSGTDGYHTYRIPAIETAPDGSLIAFAEARKHGLDDPGFGQQDIDLVFKRSSDSGATWSPMTVLEDPGERWSAANPATVVDRTQGRIWVFYLRSRPGRSTETSRPGTDDLQTLARSSDDNGRGWSNPIDLTSVARDLKDPAWQASVPGPGGAIQDRHGRLIVPMWKVPFATFAIYSDDHGQSWQRGQCVPGNHGGDECQVVELADGRILMDIRQEQGAHRWQAESADGGQTWGPARPGLQETMVACAIERYPRTNDRGDGDRLLWTGPKEPERRRLVIRASRDEGGTFAQERLISNDYAAYSDLTILKDNTVGVLWERGVQRGYQFLTFTRLNRAWLERGASVADSSAASPSR